MLGLTTTTVFKIPVTFYTNEKSFISFQQLHPHDKATGSMCPHQQVCCMCSHICTHIKYQNTNTHFHIPAADRSAACRVMAWLWSSATDRAHKRKTCFNEWLLSFLGSSSSVSSIVRPELGAFVGVRVGGYCLQSWQTPIVIIILPTGICGP